MNDDLSDESVDDGDFLLLLLIVGGKGGSDGFESSGQIADVGVLHDE